MWIIQKLSRVFGFSVYSIRIVGNVSLHLRVISSLDSLWNVDVGNALPYKGMWCHIFCPSWLAVDVSVKVVSARLYFEYYIFDSNIWIYAQGVCVNHIRLRWRNIFLVFLDLLFRNLYCVYKCTSTKPFFFVFTFITFSQEATALYKLFL